MIKELILTTVKKTLFSFQVSGCVCVCVFYMLKKDKKRRIDLKGSLKGETIGFQEKANSYNHTESKRFLLYIIQLSICLLGAQGGV